LEALYAIITKGKKNPHWDEAKKRKWISDWEQQAVRTAWCVVKDWVEAQMALVETQMLTSQQVFLPYALMSDGRTLSEHVGTNPRLPFGRRQLIYEILHIRLRLRLKTKTATRASASSAPRKLPRSKRPIMNRSRSSSSAKSKSYDDR
jgi:hypothetical protein